LITLAQAAVLNTLHVTLDQLRHCVGELRDSYGDIPAVLRLTGDVDRMVIDAAELDVLPAPPPARSAPPGLSPITVLTDDPVDPALWADADDEGLGGYRRGSGR
jgi:hypothetical protein